MGLYRKQLFLIMVIFSQQHLSVAFEFSDRELVFTKIDPSAISLSRIPKLYTATKKENCRGKLQGCKTAYIPTVARISFQDVTQAARQSETTPVAIDGRSCVLKAYDTSKNPARKLPVNDKDFQFQTKSWKFSGFQGALSEIHSAYSLNTTPTSSNQITQTYQFVPEGRIDRSIEIQCTRQILNSTLSLESCETDYAISYNDNRVKIQTAIDVKKHIKEDTQDVFNLNRIQIAAYRKFIEQYYKDRNIQKESVQACKVKKIFDQIRDFDKRDGSYQSLRPILNALLIKPNNIFENLYILAESSGSKQDREDARMQEQQRAQKEKEEQRQRDLRAEQSKRNGLG